MKFAVATLFASVSAHKIGELMTETDYKFMNFVAKHGRSYGTRAEYNFRLDIFKQKVAKIEEHNAKEGVTWTLGVNHFTDRTEEEIKKQMGLMEKPLHETGPAIHKYSESDIQESVDWRQKGAVTPIKNQGHCGSCWAFATVGALEGAHFLKSGELLSLSEQQLVDCSEFDMGCHGGRPFLAYLYTGLYHLETEADYPYRAEAGFFKCTYDKTKGKVGAKSIHGILSDSPNQMKAALTLGPISVAIHAGQDAFMHYQSGIITSKDTICHFKQDHAVLVVGHGTDENGLEYFIVKNSWGAAWGESGFVRVAVEDGVGAICINMTPSQPVVA
jgi:C1A family cysteine protease